MARRRFNIHHRVEVESFLRKISSRVQNFIYRWNLYHRFLVLLLVGIFIAVGIPSALSQIPIINPVAQKISIQQLMEEGKAFYEQGEFQNAKNKLEEVVKILESPEGQKGQEINHAKVLIDLALVYQKLGNFESAQEEINSSLKILEEGKHLDKLKKQELLVDIWKITSQLSMFQGNLKYSLDTSKTAEAFYRKLSNNKGGHYIQDLLNLEYTKKDIEKQIKDILDNNLESEQDVLESKKLQEDLKNLQNAIDKRIEETINKLPNNRDLLKLEQAEKDIGKQNKNILDNNDAKKIQIYKQMKAKINKLPNNINNMDLKQTLLNNLSLKQDLVNLDAKRKQIDEQIEAKINNISKETQNSSYSYDIQSKVLQSLGNLLRVQGDLDGSEIILNDSIEKAKEGIKKVRNAEDKKSALLTNLIKDEKSALLSLGNTFWASANLEINRVATTNYEYIPWRCNTINLDTEDSNFNAAYDKAKEEYKKAKAQYEEVEKIDNNSNEEKAISIIITKAKLNRLRLRTEREELKKLMVQKKQKLTAEDSQDLDDDILKDEIYSGFPKGFSESRARIYAEINYFKNIFCSPQKDEKSDVFFIENLTGVIEKAKDLKDNYAISYALGNLGGYYYESLSKENRDNYLKKAQALTYQALILAQPIQSPEIAYQWQWQLGRIYKALCNKEEAIKAYRNAVTTLESVRSNLLSINSDVQFNFRDNIEPVYRELVSLLLDDEENDKLLLANEKNDKVNEEMSLKNKIKESLYYLESIQLAELENFLRCNSQDLIVNQNKQNHPPITLDDKIKALDDKIEKILQDEPTSALIFPIILKDKLVVILKKYNDENNNKKYPLYSKTYYFSNKESSEDLQKTLKKAKAHMKPGAFNNKPWSELYKYLIQPFEIKLEENKNKIKVVRFVLDGSLRNIPMAALYDDKEQKFLVEKDYATTIVPSIQILRPKSPNILHWRAMVGGSTIDHNNNNNNNVQRYYNNVCKQVKIVIKELNSLDAGCDQPGEVKFPDVDLLITPEFTKDNLKAKFKSSTYNLVHLVTHGKFSSNLKDTFILVDRDNKNGEKLNISNIEDLFQPQDQNNHNSINLLVLSACSTASGDNRAILGIAGVAIKSGAYATIAPLIDVEQEDATDLFVGDKDNFYKQLFKEHKDKAEALHIAQKSLLNKYRKDVTKGESPHYWAPFVLVGS